MQLGMDVFRGKEGSRDHRLLFAFIGDQRHLSVLPPISSFHCSFTVLVFCTFSHLTYFATFDEHSLYLVSFNVSIMCIFQIKWSIGLSGCLSITPPKKIGVREETVEIVSDRQITVCAHALVFMIKRQRLGSNTKMECFHPTPASVMKYMERNPFFKLTM